MIPRLAVTSGIMALLAGGAARADDKKPAAQPSATAVDARPIIERGLAALERDGLAWWKQRKCNGCHHGGFLVWSHLEAQRRGLNVDPQKLQAWTRQAIDFHLANEKDHRTKKNGHVEAMSILLGRPTLAAPGGADAALKTASEKAQPGDGKSPKSLQAVVDLVVLAQAESGFFKYAGQPLKRADGENDEATTLWAVLTLAPLAHDNASLARSRDAALAWLKKTPAGPSNEALALRLLVEKQFGEPARVQRLRDALIRQQHADGGWSWTKDRPSEPYATGQTLYALGRTGLAGEDAAVRRGVAFLAAQQKPDGAWSSPSRKPNVSGNAIADYWGTAWATIGLLHTLPERK